MVVIFEPRLPRCDADDDNGKLSGRAFLSEVPGGSMIAP
jgi:hypothetical protein